MLAAAAAETTTRVLEIGFWWAVLIPTVIIFAIGARFVRARAPALLAQLRPVTAPSLGVEGSASDAMADDR